MGFDKIIGAIDGLVICTILPPLQICREIDFVVKSIF